MPQRHHQAQDAQAQDRPTVGRTAGCAAALVAGAAAQYLLDPVSGRSRRTRLAQQLGAAVRRRAKKATDQAEKTTQVAQDKVVGKARGALSSSGPPPNDQALAEKIRSEVLGTDPFRDYRILVDCADGDVTIRGEVKHAEEVKDLERAVRAVEGVGEVTNLVHLPGTDPANIRPSVEASRGGRGPRPS